MYSLSRTIASDWPDSALVDGNINPHTQWSCCVINYTTSCVGARAVYCWRGKREARRGTAR